MMQEPAHSLEALGSLLRQTREARGLTLTEVANDTFIRCQYLQALEEADLSRLPEPVYVQGFLKRYADYLGLDGETLSRRASPLLSAKTPRAPAPLAVVGQQPAFALRPLHLWAAYVVLIVLTVGGLSALLEGTGNPFGRWLVSLSTVSREGSGQQPPAANSPDPHSVGSSAHGPANCFPPSTNGRAFRASSPRSWKLTQGGRGASRCVWIFALWSALPGCGSSPMGKTVFEATLQPGAELNWEAEQSIVLRTGNAGGVLVTFNDRELGVMGRFGEVKELMFEPGWIFSRCSRNPAK
jgi:cytoskeleton protein RodZ